MLTAIMGAMPDEVDQLAALLENKTTETYAGVEYVKVFWQVNLLFSAVVAWARQMLPPPFKYW